VIVAFAANFTQKRTVIKERTFDAIRVPVAYRLVVGLEVLAVRWHHAVTKVRATLRLNMPVVAKGVSRVEKICRDGQGWPGSNPKSGVGKRGSDRNFGGEKGLLKNHGQRR